MTATKEQEREALAKIKNIVEEVGGADSYIGMAFEGCFELAEENINEDGGYSWQSKYQSVCEELNTVKAELGNRVKLSASTLCDCGSHSLCVACSAPINNCNFHSSCPPYDIFSAW